MLKPQGYATIVDPDAPIQEYDSCSCGHCQRVIFVKPRSASTVYLLPTEVPGRFTEESGAFCRLCMRPVCLACHARGNCVPWERMLEASEARGRLLRACT
jgi:hypothetical protein